MDNKLSSDQWSTYWRRGTPTTFLGRFQDNYDGAIAEFWHDQFLNLPDDATIVDLATGNGALAMLAARHADMQQKNFTIAAIDYADIDPADLVLSKEPESVRDRITLFPQTPIEKLKLEDHSQDFAISQFGFEYANAAEAVKELSRVLKTEARFVAMMHRENSVLLEQASDGLAQVEICHKTALHEKLKLLLQRIALVRQAGRDPADDDAAEELRADINDITLELHDAMDEHEEPAQIGFFLEHSMAVFKPPYAGLTTEDKFRMLDLVREETESYRLRMSDLTVAARSGNDIDALEQLLTGEGFRVTKSEPFELEGQLFAHLIEAERG